MSTFEVDPQPRIDVRVEDAASGEPRRLTTYSGLVWYGGRINVTESFNSFHTDWFEGPFFLPDSLPYDPARSGTLTVAATVALQGTGGEWASVLASGSVVPDPRGQPVSWVQVHLAGKGRIPIGLSYRVEVLATPDAVLPQPE